MQVRELGSDERAELHPHFAGWVTPALQCSPGSFWPSLGQLRRAVHTFAAFVGEIPVGAALVDASGRIDWMLTAPGYTAAAFPAILELVYTTCGAGHGYVANPDLCQAYVDSSAGRLVRADPDDPAVVRWSP